MNSPATPVRILFRADDAGSSRSANLAVREVCERGVVRNVSLMACCACIEHARDLLADLPGVCFGLHVTLNAEWPTVRWGPVLPASRVPSLVDDRGHFLPATGKLDARGVSLDEAMDELRAQLDRLRGLGFDVGYVDQHMGVGWVRDRDKGDRLEDRLTPWAEREGLVCDWRVRRHLPGVAAAGGETPVQALRRRLRAAPSGTYVVVGHPACGDDAELLSVGADVAAQRDADRCLFVDPALVALARGDATGIASVRYSDLESLA